MPRSRHSGQSDVEMLSPRVFILLFRKQAPGLLIGDHKMLLREGGYEAFEVSQAHAMPDVGADESPSAVFYFDTCTN